jgi:hypothetical protein
MRPGAYSPQRHEVRQLGRDAMLAGGDPGVVQPGQSELLGPLPGGSFVSRVDLLRCEGVDALAMNTTIALALSRPNAPTQEQLEETPPVKAIILFGVGGTAATAEVDFIDGALLTLPASTVILSAELDGVTQADNPPLVEARAFLAYLPIGHVRPAQRTLRQTIGAGATAVFPVPSFSHSFQVFGGQNAYTVVQSSDLAGADVIQTDVIAPPYPPHAVMPMTNQTRFVRVTNPGGVAQRVSLIFGLYL